MSAADSTLTIVCASAYMNVLLKKIADCSGLDSAFD